ncbi:MAG: PQQ-dependent sugar dehydrogenase [Candidatus Pseudobacter hemicellulosilyticus]|uniref:PQQ-dependent sugar dehydrogenase n=1 Tax=Candidatus Pseudobacter hemicellulosilyticus TaxID=3121375 RepID=A0AAJ6BHK7_9BACT|nr:MAG: PQQ-dependent sugar dehydrogenase [Pseudobacter sp.]
MKAIASAWAIQVLTLMPIIGICQDEPFLRTELNRKPVATNNRYYLAHPFDIEYGRDNFLYITEKVGRILRVDTGTGQRTIILDLRAKVKLNISRQGNGVATGIGQNGMLGMALHPGFATGTGKDSLYVAYCYDWDHIRIARFYFNGTVLVPGSETTILEGIPASGDHSSGRLIIGADNKLYYSCGDLGHNQFDRKCLEVRSQKLPTSTEMTAKNYDNYSGKILRISLNGGIPADNPLWGGIRSHIYSIGHRNPQGLAWQKEPSNGVPFPVLTPNGILFSSEQGPNSDDELNIIEGGRNYGWPYIAGDTDNVNFQYVQWRLATNCSGLGFQENPNYVPAGVTPIAEKNAPADVKANFRKPLKQIYTGCGTRPAAECALVGNWLKFPTIAPSSIEYYNLNISKGIPGWYPSVLVPTLKAGTLYRFKLNAAQNAFVGDSIPYFKSYNRYRDIAMSPDGKIFLITDSVGSTSGPSSHNPATLDNPGALLVFQYIGMPLSLKDPNEPGPENPLRITVAPNPARDFIHVDFGRLPYKPVRYQLYDMLGRLAVEGSSSTAAFTIQVAQLRRGMYVLKLLNRYGAELRMDKILLQ